jgi:hypothetical protein
VRPKVISKSTPHGGFGNRVLSYLSLRHVAAANSVDYRSVNSSDSDLISGINRRLFFPLAWTRFQVISAADTSTDGGPDLVTSILSEGKSLVIRGAMLGETFARFAAPGSDLAIKNRAQLCQVHRNRSPGKNLVTVHMRAGDFRTWDPDAILPADYYITAINRVEEDFGPLKIRICIDDTTHPGLAETEKYIRQRGIERVEVDCLSPFECDFAAMASSRVLISSPSTFAICAGLLGTPEVIHNRAWINNRISRNELFWEKVMLNELPSYRVLGIY